MNAIRVKKTLIGFVSISLIIILVIGLVNLSNSLSSKYKVPDEMNLKLNQTRDQFNLGFKAYTANRVFQEESRRVIDLDGDKVIRQVLNNTFTKVTFLYTIDGDPIRIDFEKLKINGNFAFTLTTIYHGNLNSWPFPSEEVRSAEVAYETDNPTWTSGEEVVVKCVKRDWYYTMEWKTNLQ